MKQKTDASQDADGEEKFETLLERLKGIVRTLETGDVPLEDSLKKFEEGMTLARACQERLTQAERKIEILVKADADSVVTEPFAAD